jgi:phosphoglycerate dehydrogenase-like enzyme
VKVVSFSHLWRDDLGSLLDADIQFVAVDPDDDAAKLSSLADADVLISTKFDASMARAAGRLRLLLCPSAGTEGIDREQLPPGVGLLNGEGHEIPIAEYVIGALVALRQKMFAADRALREGRWEYGFLGVGGFVSELHGSKLGMLGYGRIGKEIVQRAAAFGIETVALTMRPEKVTTKPPGLALVGDLKDRAAVDAVVSRSDALVVCCELSAQTRGLIDARRLGLMKKHAVIVNIARGPIIDEEALYEALKEHTIEGAALDVWYEYPHERGELVQPSRLPFGQLDNVIMTPHCSGWTEGHRRRKLGRMADAIHSFKKTNPDL